ncbi:MAG TPA: class I SAM-dependent methyltransferase [Anaerolineales bacterium]|nr:class I SAM-dependent methyltransferase [Anaerolineales bacterium]HRQ91283.1 class I SAM-dependent methyltransferase [Anaerolineales bacterium]
MSNPKLILAPGRQRSLERRHPWVFASAIAKVEGSPQSGDTAAVYAAGGQFLATAAYSQSSQIRARVWSWQQGEAVDAEYFRRRIEAAIALRKVANIHQDGPAATDSLRLVHAESDGLPGVIVDQYGGVLVLQCLNWGAERWRETIADVLMELCAPQAILERSDADVRELEGLPPRVGLLRGQLPAAPQLLRESGLQFELDLTTGHKTGYYLDQRANRALLGSLAAGREVLDCFSYTGGFAAHALRGGAAKVTLVDDSGAALELAARNLAHNSLPAEKAEFIDGDVFQVLRRFRDSGRQFDMIVLDPPKFAPTRATAERAARGYKDINLLALKLLRPGGLLFTFSCSGGVDAALFQKIVAGAALDAGVDARIVHRMSQGADHPVALNFPEGEYLKGLVVEVS